MQITFFFEDPSILLISSEALSFLSDWGTHVVLKFLLVMHIINFLLGLPYYKRDRKFFGFHLLAI